MHAYGACATCGNAYEECTCRFRTSNQLRTDRRSAPTEKQKAPRGSAHTPCAS